MSSTWKQFARRKTQRQEYYGFSVKILKSPKASTERNYEPWLKHLYSFKQIRVVCIVAEEDKNHVLHYHGVIRLPDTFYRRKLCIKGYHTYFSYIWNMKLWMEYIYKNFRLGGFCDTIDLNCDEKLVSKITDINGMILSYQN